MTFASIRITENLTEILWNIARPLTILIEVEAVRLASECLFGDTEVKVAGTAVIAVTLAGVMVTFSPSPSRWQDTTARHIKGRGKADASYGAGAV